MGKFSDYVATIKNQTDDLREVVSAKSGVDCSKYSISECTGVIDNISADLDYGYKRPSWYPNIEEIVMNAPDIVKDGKTYRPVYSILFNDEQITTPFYKANSTTNTDVNYKVGTGVDAYIFGDTINNDISSINDSSLEIGQTIVHEWNFNGFIKNPSGSERVSWVIAYTSVSATQSISTYIMFENAIEVVIRQGMYGDLLGKDSYGYNTSIKYIKVCKDVKSYSASTSSCKFYNIYALEEFVNEGNIQFNSGMTSLTNLKKLTNNGLITVVGTSTKLSYLYNIKNLNINNAWVFNLGTMQYCFQNMYSMKNITFDVENIEYAGNGNNMLQSINLINTKVITNTSFGYGFNLKHVKIPSTLITWNTSRATLPHCPYVELFNDFNISGVNLTGQVPKKLQWLKDLCGWLKDRTGEDANTMIIGTDNLNNANAIYLTFNPDDKRDITFDGVTAETEGAISITEFITTQLNWTLS